MSAGSTMSTTSEIDSSMLGGGEGGIHGSARGSDHGHVGQITDANRPNMPTTLKVHPVKPRSNPCQAPVAHSRGLDVGVRLLLERRHQRLPGVGKQLRDKLLAGARNVRVARQVGGAQQLRHGLWVQQGGL